MPPNAMAAALTFRPVDASDAENGHLTSFGPPDEAGDLLIKAGIVKC